RRSVFFSSRRRHTRFSRDWSSDVCSSDLTVTVNAVDARWNVVASVTSTARMSTTGVHATFPDGTDVTFVAGTTTARVTLVREERSEERRVGEEGGTKRRQYHEQGRSTPEL